MTKTSSKLPFIIGLCVITLTVVAVFLIYSSEPVAQKDGATKRSAMLVDVTIAKQSQYTPTISAMGVVVPAQEVQLKPRLTGEVEQLSGSFVPGNIVNKGQWLVKLQSNDFDLALQRAEAELTRAKSLYDMEMGEQEVAKNDFAKLNRQVSSMNRSLILREPQLNQVNADLQTAEVALREAQLAVERTVITMPFDGQVMSQNVNVGSQVSPADVIAQIVGIERYWIEAAVPLSKLKWLNVSRSASDNNIQQQATILNQTAWPTGASRTAQVKEVIAALDPQTRMATVLLEINDPLVSQQQTLASDPQAASAPLLAGSYVEVMLPAKTLNEVVRVPISYLRKGNTLWMENNGTLNIKSVSVVFRDEEFAYIENGIQTGDRIITTNLASVKEGAAVRVRNVIDSSNKSSSVDSSALTDGSVGL